MQQSDTHHLALGRRQAISHRSMVAAQDEAMRLLPGLEEVIFTKPDDFSFRTSVLHVDTFQIGAFAASPACMRFGDRRDPAFVFPWCGVTAFRAGKRTLTMQSHSAAIFIPPGQHTRAEGGARSVVVARLDARRLLSTLDAMLGPRQSRLQAGVFQLSTEVKLTFGDISFDHLFRNLADQINAYLPNQEMLDHSGLDDVFYRTLVIAMNAEVFARQSEGRPACVGARQLDRVCQYIMGHLAQPITLTDLERLAFMSRRTLHNAFVRRYGLSPMGWVREQRLLAARALLRETRSYQTVSEVLYSCGFTNPSLFSLQYHRRFGELPSAALTRVRGTKGMTRH